MSTPEFVNDMTFYDSLVRSTCQVNPYVLGIVKAVNLFIHNFILHEKKHAHLRENDAALIDRVHYCDCPIQKNGFDCGLFAWALNYTSSKALMSREKRLGNKTSPICEVRW